jgi:hypothetical protein
MTAALRPRAVCDTVFQLASHDPDRVAVPFVARQSPGHSARSVQAIPSAVFPSHRLTEHVRILCRGRVYESSRLRQSPRLSPRQRRSLKHRAVRNRCFAK